MKLNIILILVGSIVLIAGIILTFVGNNSRSASEEVVSVSNSDSALPLGDIGAHTPSNNQQNTQNLHTTPTSSSSQPSATDSKKSQSQDAKEKGNNFEDFIANTLKANSIRIKEWNKGAVTDEGAFADNALNPDFFLLDAEGKVNLEYWLECKYRSSIPGRGFELNDYQITRYQQIQKDSKRKILICLGVAGEPSAPSKIYIIPLDTLIRYKHMPEKYLSSYEIPNPRVSLKKHIRDYFYQQVFKKQPKGKS